MSPTPRPFLLLLALVLLATTGCDKKNPGDLPEWSPADHDNQTNPQPGQVDTSKPKAGMPSLQEHGITDVVLATWKQNCVPCHGLIGRGDGPQGAALRPTDLTNPQWQRVAIDSEILHTIKNGRGRMPAFSSIPDETAQGLVRLVRMLNANPEPAPEAQAGDAPAGAAAPSTAAPAPSASPHGSSQPSSLPAPGGLPAGHPPISTANPSPRAS